MNKSENTFFTRWYNGTTIEDYFKIITQNSINSTYTFNVDFLNKYQKDSLNGIKSWIKTDIFNKDMLFFPINTNSHWILIAVKMEIKKIECYDSRRNIHMKTLNAIRKFLTDWESHSGRSPSIWTITHMASPLQTNNHDCGPWVLETAKCLALNTPLYFNQEQMRSIRINQHTELAINDFIITKHAPSTNILTNITTTTPGTTQIKTITSETSSTTASQNTPTIPTRDKQQQGKISKSRARRIKRKLYWENNTKIKLTSQSTNPY